MFDCLKWWLEAAQHEDKQSIAAYNFNRIYNNILDLDRDWFSARLFVT